MKFKVGDLVQIDVSLSDYNKELALVMKARFSISHSMFQYTVVRQQELTKVHIYFEDQLIKV